MEQVSVQLAVDKSFWGTESYCEKERMRRDRRVVLRVHNSSEISMSHGTYQCCLLSGTDEWTRGLTAVNSACPTALINVAS